MMKILSYPRTRDVLVLTTLIVCGQIGPNISHARDLFIATVGSGNNTEAVSGNTFKNVLRDTIELMEANLLLSPTARLNYAGIADALQLDVDLEITTPHPTFAPARGGSFDHAAGNDQ